MSEQTENTENTSGMTELQMLKQRADAMGISYSNNIGVDALKAKIQAKMDGTDDKDGKDDGASNEGSAQVNALTGAQAAAPEPAKPTNLRQHLINEAMKLVRLRITNLDPKKADLPGEVFTVANEYIGTVRKYVPFGEATDEGYHVPWVIYEMMKNRQFLQIKSKTHPVTKQVVVTQRWVREFGLEVLEPLTESEIATLAAAQTASGRLNGE